jgi:hypothetical protein
MFMNEVTLHFENHKIHEKNSEFMTVEDTGTYNDHCGLKD